MTDDKHRRELPRRQVLQDNCGSSSSTDELWTKAQQCKASGTSDPECLVVELTQNPVYCVVHGRPENTYNYLLVPTDRIRGIECDYLWGKYSGNNEVFSPGFAVQGRAGEASLHVSAVSRPSVECLLGGACSEGSRAGSP